MVLLRKSVPQNYNLKTAAELGVMQRRAMKKIYSVWALEGECTGHCLVVGEGPLQYANGKIDEECEVRLYTFEAFSFEEAMSIYHLRQGWEPYKPSGNAAPCPSCGVMHYPKGSGECWHCEHHC